jgi:hypothetical protein
MKFNPMTILVETRIVNALIAKYKLFKLLLLMSYDELFIYLFHGKFFYWLLFACYGCFI